MMLRSMLAAVSGLGLLAVLSGLGLATAQEEVETTELVVIEEDTEQSTGREDAQEVVIERLRAELDLLRQMLEAERAARKAIEDRVAAEAEAEDTRRPSRGRVRVGGPDALVSVEIPGGTWAVREANRFRRDQDAPRDDREAGNAREHREAPDEIEVAEARVDAARASLDAAEVRVNLAEERQRLFERRLSSGVSPTDRLDSVIAITEAEAQVAESRAQLAEARAQLVEAEFHLAHARRQTEAEADGQGRGKHEAAIEEAFETAERVIDIIQRFRREEGDKARDHVGKAERIIDLIQRFRIEHGDH